MRRASDASLDQPPEKHEFLAMLRDTGLVHQHDCRQVGGWPWTRLLQSLAELLDPRVDRHMRPLNAEPAEHSLDVAKAHTTIVQQDRQLDEGGDPSAHARKTQSRPALQSVREGSC